MEVSINEAKTRLSRLIERALAGEEIVVVKAGRPVVRITRIEQAPVLGSARGTVSYKRGWDKALSKREAAEIFGAPTPA